MPSTSQQSVSPALYAITALCVLGSVAAVYVIDQIALAALLGLAGLLVSCFTHPLVPFSLYFITLFFKDTVVAGLPVSVNQVLAPLFLLAAFIYIIRGKGLRLQFALLPLLTIVAVYFTASGILGQDLENGLLYGRYVVIYFIMAVCLAACMSRERTIHALAWIIVIATTGAALAGFAEGIQKGLLTKFAGNWGWRYRIAGGAANSIVYAWNMLFAFPFAFLLYAESGSRYTRLLALFLGMIILGAAAITFNRQTYVVIAVIIILCAFLYTYRNRVVLLGMLTGLTVLGSFTIFPLILKRLFTLTNIAHDYSYLERRDSYLIGLEMFRDYPVFGVGFGAYSKVWRQYLPEDFATYFAQYRLPSYAKFMDMGIMAVLVETGIVGLILFLAFFLVILVRTWRYRKAAMAVGDHFARNLASTVLVILAFITATSLIQDTFLYTRVWIFYAVAMLLDERQLPLRHTESLEDQDDQSVDELPGGEPVLT